MSALRFQTVAFLIIVVGIGGTAVSADAAEQQALRPNILWISCEDISPRLGCYGDATATTPNLDKFASQGTLFTHAFTCHGVCAPSRTGIITGMFPTSLGANHMRSKAGLPSHVRLFPQLLREAGYYCTNNSKTDYNLKWDEQATWDESSGKAHWKNRPTKDTPFFAVFNLTMTHESKVWPSGWKEVVAELPPEKRHQAKDMIVPPLYPDTPAVRDDFARLADLITVMDKQAGRRLEELAEAGLSDNTIVMFWSDHGNGLPRSKRWTYDSGSRVPLIVRVPESMREAAGVSTPGSKDDRAINMIDLGPTVLNLAGVETPESMQGRPFLGQGRHEGHVFIYGARDRLDERFDMVRTVRTRRYRYVRNLMPWRPALQHVTYGETNETLKEMRRLLKDGKLTPEYAQWFNTPRPAEELYDLSSDPWELKNLAASSEHQQILKGLRARMDEWQVQTRDSHLLPEIMLDEAQKKSGERWSLLQGDAGMARTKLLVEEAKRTSHLQATDVVSDVKQLSDDDAIRWWQVTLAAHAPGVETRIELLQHESTKGHVAIRIAAAGGLARAGRTDEAAVVLSELIRSDSEFVRHAALLEIDESTDALRLALAIELKSLDVKNHEYSQRIIEHTVQ